MGFLDGCFSFGEGFSRFLGWFSTGPERSATDFWVDFLALHSKSEDIQSLALAGIPPKALRSQVGTLSFPKELGL